MTAKRRNSVTNQLRRAYSEADLARVLTMPEGAFGRAFGMETVELGEQKGSRKWWKRKRGLGDLDRYYHFRDNGASVLAVAHLDTVVRPAGRVPRFTAAQSGPHVVSGALDDRLGAYVILKLLPAMGLTCDWLLTVGEEDGESTAEDFQPGKDYDWVIEFDRGGTDVVMYQYEDKATRELVQACGAQVGTGSFSDIAYLEHLGVKAFNWGAGYRGRYHSESGYAYLSDTFAMAAKYLRFHDQNKGTILPHVAEDPAWWDDDDRDPAWWDDDDRDPAWWDDDDTGTLECEVCGGKVVGLNDDACPACRSCVYCFLTDEEGCQCYKRHALSGKPLTAENNLT